MAHAACPNCSTVYDLPVEKSGKKVRCGRCQCDFRVRFDDASRIPFVSAQELPPAVKSDPQIAIAAPMPPLDPAVVLRTNGFRACVAASYWLGIADDLSGLLIAIGLLAVPLSFFGGPIFGFLTLTSFLPVVLALRVCGAASELIIAAAHRNVRDGIRGDTWAPGKL